MPITESERRYLKNKHKGGWNNEKGNRYEGYYAIYQIALLINTYYGNLDAVHLTSHVPDAFVDDLLISKPSCRVYHQLKDVKDLSWGYSNVKNDFKRQIDISKEQNEQFKLKLVNSKRDFSNIPAEISEFTVLEYFPSYNTLDKLYWEYPEFRRAIENIAVPGRDNNDELMAIAITILGVWNSIDTPVSLKDIVDKVRKNNSYDSLKIYPSIELSDETKKVLDRLNVVYYVNGEILYWSFGNFSGKVIWTSEKEHLLIKSSPLNIVELIPLLS